MSGRKQDSRSSAKTSICGPKPGLSCLGFLASNICARIVPSNTAHPRFLPIIEGSLEVYENTRCAVSSVELLQDLICVDSPGQPWNASLTTVRNCVRDPLALLRSQNPRTTSVGRCSRPLLSREQNSVVRATITSTNQFKNQYIYLYC